MSFCFQVFHERAQRSGRVVRCHLVIEDVSRTKRCAPLSNFRSANFKHFFPFQDLTFMAVSCSRIWLIWLKLTSSGPQGRCNGAKQVAFSGLQCFESWNVLQSNWSSEPFVLFLAAFCRIWWDFKKALLLFSGARRAFSLDGNFRFSFSACSVSVLKHRKWKVRFDDLVEKKLQISATLSTWEFGEEDEMF